jgi:SAM-dependent methyltransferase
MDWGVGCYERVAAQLLDAARVCVDCAAVAADERVIDVGCGTGNAALLAAERGARVTGVDPAGRLLEIAGERARALGLDVRFLSGEAASLPLASASAEVVLSVFGVIFAPDAQAAAAELARVRAPAGRIVLCAWTPAGALFEVMRMRGEAIAFATGGTVGPEPFPWHEEDALRAVFAPHGLSVEQRSGLLAFTGSSPEDFVDAELRDHPVWITARTLLARDELEAVRDRAVEILRRANERRDGFQVTSRYLVATLQPG